MQGCGVRIQAPCTMFNVWDKGKGICARCGIRVKA